MSTHQARVVRLGEIVKHPNADRLGLVEVYGYQCGVRLGDFSPGDLAVFIEPDTLIPTDQPEFEFLKGKAIDGYARIRAEKFRGLVSYGLLVKARAGWGEGQDVFEELKLKHWQPVEVNQRLGLGADCEASPKLYAPVYDVEALRKYPDVFQEGEGIVITEKIHGTNARFVWHHDMLHCGSHRTWKRDALGVVWWDVARQYDLEKKLKAWPGLVVYGEIYGQVQDLTYGTTPENPYRLAVFDLIYDGKWLDQEEFVERTLDLNLPVVPVLAMHYIWDRSLFLTKGKIVEFSDGPSVVAGAEHPREGCVVRAWKERTVPEVGRAVLKVISGWYATRKEG